MNKFNAIVIFLFVLIKLSHQLSGPTTLKRPINSQLDNNNADTEYDLETVEPVQQRAVCELLIVELFERFYTLNSEDDVLLINCNAFFADFMNSRCSDDSVFNIRFDLIVDGITLVHEYMKRRYISDSGFLAKFEVKAKMLINRTLISPNSAYKSQVVCRATVSTDIKTIINQSLQSYLLFNNQGDKTSTKQTEKLTTERYNSSIGSQITTNHTTACGSLLVNILHKNYIIDADQAIKPTIEIACIAVFRTNNTQTNFCPSNNYMAYAGLEIDGYIVEWKAMRVYYNYSTEYFIANNKITVQPNLFEAKFEKNFSYFSKNSGVYQTRCHVSLQSISSNQSVVSPMLVKLNKNVSSLYESCSTSLECDATQNLMCSSNRICLCRYDYTRSQYYIPFRQNSSNWTCIEPVGYNERCIADVQCKSVTFNTLCATLSIGKVCVCDQHYHWNGRQCVFHESVTKSSINDFTSDEMLTPSYEYITSYRVSAAKVVALSFGAIAVGYVVIAVVLHVLVRKQKKQYKKNRNANNRLQRKYDARKFMPHVYLIEEKKQHNQEIVKEHTMDDVKIIA